MSEENLLNRINHNRLTRPISLVWGLCLLLSVVAGQAQANTADDSRYHHIAVEQTQGTDSTPDCLMEPDVGNLHAAASLGDSCCHDVNQGETFSGDGGYGASLGTCNGAMTTRYLSFSSIHPDLLYRPPIQ